MVWSNNVIDGQVSKLSPISDSGPSVLVKIHLSIDTTFGIGKDKRPLSLPQQCDISLHVVLLVEEWRRRGDKRRLMLKLVDQLMRQGTRSPNGIDVVTNDPVVALSSNFEVNLLLCGGLASLFPRSDLSLIVCFIVRVIAIGLAIFSIAITVSSSAP